jgi:hypothetical protein
MHHMNQKYVPIIATYCIDRLVFIMHKDCVFCDVKTEVYYRVRFLFSGQPVWGVQWTEWHWSVRVRCAVNRVSLASPCEACSEQSGAGQSVWVVQWTEWHWAVRVWCAVNRVALASPCEVCSEQSDIGQSVWGVQRTEWHWTGFSPSVLFLPSLWLIECSIFVFTLIPILSVEQAEKKLETFIESNATSISDIGKYLTEKYTSWHCFLIFKR